MKKKAVFFTFLVFFVFSIVQAASAGLVWNPNDAPKKLNAENWISIADTLNLTDEQITKIQNLQKAHYEKSKILRAQLQDNWFALKQLCWQKNVDKKTVEEKINKINDLRSQLYNEHQKYRQEIESILTQEQRERLKSICKPKGESRKHGKIGSNGFGSPAA